MLPAYPASLHLKVGVDEAAVQPKTLGLSSEEEAKVD
jgi:hypothetical protein